MIRISISKQMLYHRNSYGVWRSYPISTARKGAGNFEGSLQTPLGKHYISHKIGDHEPIMTVFRARQSVGIYQEGADDPHKDWILSRILWLSGTQTGFNKRGHVDTHARYIYIHGTHEEECIGRPASHGCIRMRNDDVIYLFKQSKLGESVIISL
ncbi:MAG: L,D-transpeptidase [Mariprofundaceae bacterium]|nr:L,D-transpeptidase [Mariprofundaceae bacterium]